MTPSDKPLIMTTDARIPTASEERRNSLLGLTADELGLTADECRALIVEWVHARDLDGLFALVESYLVMQKSGKKGVSGHTLQAYRRGLQDLLSAWADEDLLAPTEDAGWVYVQTLTTRLKPASVGVKLASAKVFYAALRWSGATTAHPFAQVKAPKDKMPFWAKGEHYTAAELERLIAVSRGESLLIVLLGAHAGLSVSEMNTLHWSDIDLEHGLVRVASEARKGNVYVELTPELVTQLGRTDPRYRTRHLFNARSRAALYIRLEVVCRRAGVAFKGVHALRRSAGINLLEETGDVTQVANHLRHASLKTVRGYEKRQIRQRQKSRSGR